MASLGLNLRVQPREIEKRAVNGKLLEIERNHRLRSVAPRGLNLRVQLREIEKRTSPEAP
jgi:5-carboxymethyl-2-hydroxymuconate isomerase